MIPKSLGNVSARGTIKSWDWLWQTYVLSLSVVSTYLWPRRLQPTRVLCPWGFFRQECWSGFSCPPPGDLPYPGIEPQVSRTEGRSLPSEPPWKPRKSLECLFSQSWERTGHSKELCTNHDWRLKEKPPLHHSTFIVSIKYNIFPVKEKIWEQCKEELSCTLVLSFSVYFSVNVMNICSVLGVFSSGIVEKMKICLIVI